MRVENIVDNMVLYVVGDNNNNRDRRSKERRRETLKSCLTVEHRHLSMSA